MGTFLKHNVVVVMFVYVYLLPLEATSATPKWKNEESLNGTNPVLTFIPVPEPKESTLIRVNRTNHKELKENIMTHLDIYYNQHKIEKDNITLHICSYNKGPSKNQVCTVNVEDWNPCSRERDFNYYRSAPCVFLKLHTPHGWVPEYYNDPYDLPEDMPHHLGDHIRSIQQPEERNKVWITCSGEYPVDVEYLGPVAYYPDKGLPGYYFPRTNTAGYLSPLVAVHFKRLAYGIVVNIECRAWAKNIHYNKTDRSGYVHFELLLD